MNIKGISKNILKLWNARGIKKLNPVQQDAMKAGLAERTNILISSPTASGKTLIAVIAIANTPKNGKSFYLVPLKALATEKYRELKRTFEPEGKKVGLSTGDPDVVDPNLSECDIIIMTVEKCDAILRRKPDWLPFVKTIVVDEVHLLDDPSRGPTLEIVLTRLKQLKNMQLLALSATVQNDTELANWMNCTLIKSDYRPADLEEGVTDGTEATFVNKKGETRSLTLPMAFPDPLLNVAKHTLGRKKQGIIFVRSRKSAEKVAEDIGRKLGSETKERIELANKVEKALERPTVQCRRLAASVKNGAAFHHAGLVQKQRDLIEQGFRNEILTFIAATPTLAMGLSLPAFQVIIRDITRYTRSGLNDIPVLEYKQMVGRAGRPEHHENGESLVIDADRDRIMEKYILGHPEEIYSKLAVEPVLRMHVLSLIASTDIASKDDLISFFARTFYGFQYQNTEGLKKKLYRVLEDLIDFGFLNQNPLEATEVGRKVVTLYLDPLSAFHLLSHLQTSPPRNLFAYLHLFAEMIELRPYFPVRKKETNDLILLLEERESELFHKVDPFDYEYESYLGALKLAVIFEAFLSEVSEEEILEQFDIAPGLLRAKTKILDWLIHAAIDLSGPVNALPHRDMLYRLKKRLKYGIREELLFLVSIPGIGRVRARKLYDANLRTSEKIRSASFEQLKKLIGGATAKKLLHRLGVKSIRDRENIMDYFKK